MAEVGGTLGSLTVPAEPPRAGPGPMGRQLWESSKEETPQPLWRKVPLLQLFLRREPL